jgi:polyhydroxybutyrate depolymerase
MGGSRRIAFVVAAVVLVGGVMAAISVRTSRGARAKAADSYYVHRPANVPRTRQAPLVVVGINGRGAEQQTGFSAAADRHGFVAAYITLSKTYTDAAAARGPGPPYPDSQYIADTIDRLRADENIDPARIFISGGSAGGAMGYRVACDFPEKIAAVGSVSGIDVLPGCKPRLPVSIMEIHGTSDPHIIFARAQGSVDHWRDVDGCPANAKTTASGNVTTQVWSPCRSKTAVAMVKLQGGGHGWYTGSPLDATETLWSFFEAHPRSAASVLTASVQSVRVAYKPAPRRVVVSLTTNEDASVRITLARAARIVASKRAEIQTGTSSLRLVVPRTVRAGSYTLTVTVTGADGERQIKRTVRLKS